MFFYDVLTALFFAVLFGLILTVGLGRHGPGRWAGFPFFFLILFLFVWAGGIWLPPFGPVVWGYTWLNFFLLALFMMLLLATVIPSRRPPRTKREFVEKAREEKIVDEVVGITIGYFFWAIILFLIIAIITRYIT